MNKINERYKKPLSYSELYIPTVTSLISFAAAKNLFERYEYNPAEDDCKKSC